MELKKFLPYQLSVLSNKVSQGIAKAYRDQHKITIPEWRVLVILSANKQQSAKELCESSQMDKVRISRTVKILLNKKLINQKVSEEDARSKKYKLTDAGQKLIRLIKPKAFEYEQILLSSFSDNELILLKTLIKQLDQQADRLLQEKQ